jgi:hypothetical protein
MSCGGSRRHAGNGHHDVRFPESARRAAETLPHSAIQLPLHHPNFSAGIGRATR